MSKKLSYEKLCEKESSRILQKIICPYCHHIYSKDESIDIGIMKDCEDEKIINCENCNKKIKVMSWVTEYRLSTQKAEEGK